MAAKHSHHACVRVEVLRGFRRAFLGRRERVLAFVQDRVVKRQIGWLRLPRALSTFAHCLNLNLHFPDFRLRNEARV